MALQISDYLVVSDLDGTLLKAGVGMPEINKEAIAQFSAMGGKFGIATGRAMAGVAPYLPDLQCMSAPAVLCNGALIYDFSTNTVLQENNLPYTVARNLVQTIMARFPTLGVEVMTVKKIFILKNNALSHRHTASDRLKYTMTDVDHLTDRWLKVLFCADPDQLAQVEHFAASLVHDGVYFVRTGENYLEMMCDGVNKASALNQVRSICNIPPGGLVVIGDYYNDLPMLQQADFSVCPENAPDDRKCHCNMVTKSCLEGGVAHFLRYLIKNAAQLQ